MKKSQIVLLILILMGLGGILYFTFDYYKKEEVKILENKAQNDKLENERKEEQQKKEKEEKEKQEEGQKEVKALLEKLQNTQKIVLGLDDLVASLETLDTSHNYKEFKTVQEEKMVKEIVSLFANSVWQENKNSNYLGKIWQFFDKENNLLLEYDGHSFLTNGKTIYVFVGSESQKKLEQYFIE